MIKVKPEKPSAQAEAKNTSTKQIAKNAVKGGPKDVKKDKRAGIGKR